MVFTQTGLPLTVAGYAAKANKTDQFVYSSTQLEKLSFGFFGEIGGLLSALKKVSRDQLQESEAEVAGEEIGDALWYLVNLSTSANYEASQLASVAIHSVREYFSDAQIEVAGPIDFRKLDAVIAVHSHGIESKRSELLADLAQASGELVAYRAAIQGKLVSRPYHELLGKLFSLLALVAGSFGLKLEDIARENLEKIIDRWPGENSSYFLLFDNDYEEHEQLPRSFQIEFIERKSGHVVQRMNGIFIGDSLTDNSNEPDDYRFHDVFHLAYIAHLGWSPVIRGLLRLKRKSRPEIDENEDGARAAIIEEGIATWIFNHAKHRSFYEGIEIGKLEYSLLKQVRNLVSGYEAASCPLWQWELAILEGFRIFRELIKQENRGGIVTVDMKKHLIKFDPLGKK